MTVGEMFMLGFRGAEVPRWLEDFAAEFGLGGVILFDYDCIDRKYERNVKSPEQLRELCAAIHALPSHPRIYVDQEGGKVRRLKEKCGFAPLVSAKAFPSLGPEEQRRQLQAAFTQMREVGIDVDLAPVVDLDINPANSDLGAVERCYSADPATTLKSARQMQAAAHAAGIDLCLKHFPGCGAATVNSHEELMDLSEVISDVQVDVFRQLAAEIPMVLFSHGMIRQWDERFPASLSQAAVRRVRGWNADAILITDDLQMEGMQKRMPTAEAALQAARAGLDLICIGNNMRDEQKACGQMARQLAEAARREPGLATNVQAAVHRLKARKKQFA